jgi:omega-6 fatty acid desaturase (delta-12 desaturase)
LFLTCLIPFTLTFALGAYLFYAQHNFPSVTFKNNIEWSYDHAALDSSSFMVMNPLMQWATANIGYHHVHHLNSRIPFYRLPEAMRSLPELQQAKRTSLSPSEILRCLRLKVWDPEQKRMLSLKEI